MDKHFYIDNVKTKSALVASISVFCCRNNMCSMRFCPRRYENDCVSYSIDRTVAPGRVIPRFKHIYEQYGIETIKKMVNQYSPSLVAYEKEQYAKDLYILLHIILGKRVK